MSWSEIAKKPIIPRAKEIEQQLRRTRDLKVVEVATKKILFNNFIRICINLVNIKVLKLI